MNEINDSHDFNKFSYENVTVRKPSDTNLCNSTSLDNTYVSEPDVNEYDSNDSHDFNKFDYVNVSVRKSRDKHVSE